jgi:hypothetical protein
MEKEIDNNLSLEEKEAIRENPLFLTYYKLKNTGNITLAKFRIMTPEARKQIRIRFCNKLESFDWNLK